MSTEVAPKKRGRPKKNAAVAGIAEEDNVIVLEATIDTALTATPVRKSRSKAVASGSGKNGTTSVATTKASTSSSAPPATRKTSGTVESASASEGISTTTVASKRTVKSSPVTVVEGKAGPDTKEAKAKPSKEPTTAKVKEPAPAKSTTIRAATAKKLLVQDNKHPITRKVQSTAPVQRVQVFEILQQARAFVKNSHDLNQGILEIVKDREAAFATETPASVQQEASEQVQTISISAQESISPRADPASEPTSSLESTQEMTIPTSTTIGAFPPPEVAQSSPTVTKLPTSNPLFTSRPKYTLPYSTATALASRQQNQRQQQQQQATTTQHAPLKKPPPSTNTRAEPPPSSTPNPRVMGPGGPQTPKHQLKPSEMHAAQLKRDPKFRELSARWTRLLVALPVALVTSYFLYQRWDEQKLYEEAVRQGRGDEWIEKMKGRGRGRALEPQSEGEGERSG